jgi:hypothetical protein
MNPIAIVATAPKAIPWRKRLRASPCKIAGIFMVVSFVRARGRVRGSAGAAYVRVWQNCLTCEIALSGAPAAAMASSFANSQEVTTAT